MTNNELAETPVPRRYVVQKTTLVMATLGLAFLGFSSTASARADRVGQMPNGSSFGCPLCHTEPAGGPRNALGLQVESTLTEPGQAGQVDWSAVFSLDADGDGATNGAELGDPDGTWVAGDASPDLVSDPNDPASTPDGPDVNNGGNNGANNGGTTGGGGDDGDDGCSTAAGVPGSAGFAVVALGVLLLVRRRS